MKIQVLSDLHLEIDVLRMKPARKADVVVLAGDIATPMYFSRLAHALEAFKMPVIYVAGNHDYWGRAVSYDIERITKELRQMEAVYSHFHFLDCGTFDLGEYRFLGCTLWSDFDLAPDFRAFCQQMKEGILEPETGRRISLLDWTRVLSLPSRFLNPQEVASFNKQHRQFLDREISNSNKKIVIVTHFCPHPNSIAEEYKLDPFTPYYCCNCEGLMRDPVKLWIHGHTHTSFDYQVNGVRVVCNPRGYGTENQKFNNKLVVEV